MKNISYKPCKLRFTNLIFIFLVSFNIHSQQLKAGAAKRVITPDQLISVSGGVGTPKPTTEKKGNFMLGPWYWKRGKKR